MVQATLIIRNAQKAMKIMGHTALPGQRRFVVYDCRLGVLLGVSYKMVTVPGYQRRQTQAELYWSSEHRKAPGFGVGACSFLNKEQYDMYLPQSFAKQMPDFAMKGFVSLPADQAQNDYMVPLKALEASIDRRYLMRLLEPDEIILPHSGDIPFG